MRSFRLILRENTMNSLVMIQPALLLGPQGPRQLIKALEMLNLRTDVSWGVYEEGSMETSTSQAQHHLDNQAFFLGQVRQVALQAHHPRAFLHCPDVAKAIFLWWGSTSTSPVGCYLLEVRKLEMPVFFSVLGTSQWWKQQDGKEPAA